MSYRVKSKKPARNPSETSVGRDSGRPNSSSGRGAKVLLVFVHEAQQDSRATRTVPFRDGKE